VEKYIIAAEIQINKRQGFCMDIHENTSWVLILREKNRGRAGKTG